MTEPCWPNDEPRRIALAEVANGPLNSIAAAGWIADDAPLYRPAFPASPSPFAGVREAPMPEPRSETGTGAFENVPLVFRDPECSRCGADTGFDGTSRWCENCGMEWDAGGKPIVPSVGPDAGGAAS